MANGTGLPRPCIHKSRLVSSGSSMSALPPKADIRQRIEHVCFVPLTDIGLAPHRGVLKWLELTMSRAARLLVGVR
jgi:hypothetical protein